ncbi:MAG: Spi family protease inhibitor, partial [Bacteroidales bacterium]|nr:Spi family protease inhibitor [Bacteroidales bacterium]
MKRSFFVLFLASIIVFSCKKSNVECEIMAPSDSVIIPIPVSTRSLDDAKNWAQRSISLSEGHNTKSCRAVRKIESCETITKNITKSDGSIPDTLMYVFNFADSLGFSIIAADPNIKPILAVTESGNYDGESSGNEAFDDYMEALKEKLGDRLGGHGHELYYWYDYVMVGE